MAKSELELRKSALKKKRSRLRSRIRKLCSEADYEAANKLKVQLNKVRDELSQRCRERVSRADLDLLFELLKDVSNEVPAGRLERVLSRPEFKKLEPILGTIFDDRLCRS